MGNNGSNRRQDRRRACRELATAGPRAQPGLPQRRLGV